MTKAQYWKVMQTHNASQYNDENRYAIFNAIEERVSDKCIYRVLLDGIVQSHNKCFLDDSLEADHA
jgi:hypothetical protein